MKDRDLAARKIVEKRSRRRRFAEEYRHITAGIPDLRTYSEVPRAEKVAALIEGDKRKIAKERQEFSRTLTPEELEAGVAQLEAAQGLHARTAQAPACAAQLLPRRLLALRVVHPIRGGRRRASGRRYRLEGGLRGPHEPRAARLLADRSGIRRIAFLINRRRE